MKKRTPGTGGRNSNTPVGYTRRIPVPSITVNKDDLKNLISILKKTGHDPTFDIDTRREQLTFTDIEFLSSQKWPVNIKHFRFRTSYATHRIHGDIHVTDMAPPGLDFTNITLEATDRDWISAREEELTRFFDQNHNLHYFFHNIKYVIAQGVLLFGLLTYWLITYFTQRGWESVVVWPILALLYLIIGLYGTLLPKVFPYLLLEPEHPSFYTRLRSALKYLIPAIFVGLIIQAILISLP